MQRINNIIARTIFINNQLKIQTEKLTWWKKTTTSWATVKRLVDKAARGSKTKKTLTSVNSNKQTDSRIPSLKSTTPLKVFFTLNYVIFVTVCFFLESRHLENGDDKRGDLRLSKLELWYIQNFSKNWILCEFLVNKLLRDMEVGRVALLHTFIQILGGFTAL